MILADHKALLIIVFTTLHYLVICKIELVAVLPGVHICRGFSWKSLLCCSLHLL